VQLSSDSMAATEDLIRQYSGMGTAAPASDPNDMNGSDFQAEPYFQRLVQN
jgi:hypothetical protein